jgi:glycosyltransferase involved in cell wall biosynthesis
MDDRVSVVIPVRDGEAYIEDALRSVASQSVPPAEIVVVDDGSTDRTPEIVKRFPNVTYLRQEPSGQAAARNYGATTSRMPLLSFLDADDLWPRDKLRRQTEALGTAGGFAAVFGHAVEFKDCAADGRAIPLGVPVPAALPGAMLTHRESFWRVGGYASEWRVGEVVDWYARAVDLGMAIVTLPDLVLLRRIHGNNLGRRTQDAAGDYLRVLRTALARRNRR